jgi:hypothetical protein
MTGYVIDEDTTDAFLDLPEPRYEPGGKTAAELAAEHGPPKVSDVPALPPLTDH